MPLVTVLLPVYNGERFLADAINSVLRQTFTDFELLVVDDGSTDGSAGIAESYRDPRIRVVRNENRLKLSGALNRGLDSAVGTYVARMDADDICVPERLRIQTGFMDSHPEIGMSGGWVRAFGDHPSSGTTFQFPLASEEIRASLLFDNPFAHPSVIFRKSLFDKFDLRFDGTYYPAEDRELWIRALEHFPAANIPRVLLQYRLHPGSMTLSGTPEMDAQALRMLGPEFSKLGLTPSPEQMKFHYFISTNRLAPGWGLAAIDRAERWLTNLNIANDTTRRFERRAFLTTIRRIWFGVCYRSLHFGWRVIRKHSASYLSSGAVQDRLTLFLALIKRQMSKKSRSEAFALSRKTLAEKEKDVQE